MQKNDFVELLDYWKESEKKIELRIQEIVRRIDVLAKTVEEFSAGIEQRKDNSRILEEKTVLQIKVKSLRQRFTIIAVTLIAVISLVMSSYLYLSGKSMAESSYYSEMMIEKLKEENRLLSNKVNNLQSTFEALKLNSDQLDTFIREYTESLKAIKP